MELLANDLSFREQFHDISAFRYALSQLMAMRRNARRFGLDVYCHRELLIAKPMPGVSMQRAIGRLSVESERRAAMAWLTRAGPFWDDMRLHDAGDWLECNGEVVTDTAVGEAAYRKLHGVEFGLISVSPSDWNFTPAEVIWRREAEGLDDRSTDLKNWWNPEVLEIELQDIAPPIRSWEDLRDASTNRFENLTFTDDCFAPLSAGVPFAKSAAERFLVLLDILDRFSRAFDATNERTPEGHLIYQKHFTGEKALFSDSSETEKRKFQPELTFAHPDAPGNSLFCTWHGKVSHLTLRLHFSWPILPGKPVYIVYAGPKITKQ